MVRLIWVLALLAGPAAAGCFGPPMPKKLHYDSGRTVEILGHTGQDLTVRLILPNGNPDVSTVRAGLFTLNDSNNGTTFAYEWQSDLPDIRDLRPGQDLHFAADMVVEHAHRDFFKMEIKVLRTDHLTVAGCDYPVIVVERTDTRGGKVAATLVLWISTSLRMPLRNETTQAGVTQVFNVVTME